MDALKTVMTEIDAQFGTMMPGIAERMKRRVKAAYWLGVADGRELDAMGKPVERRSESRTRPI